MKWGASDTPPTGRNVRKASMAPKSPQPSTPPPSAPLADTIKAYVRVRPKGETDETEQVVRMANATCEVTTNRRGRDTKYTFTYDDCFWSGDGAHCGKPFASQETLFHAVGMPLVDNVLQGYNSAVIAYGQTGSGKTYSIFGPPSSLGTPDEGLIPRVCSELFNRLQDLSRDGRTMWSVHMSMVEVYLEDVFDLLHGRRKLSIRGDCTQGFHIVGGKRISVTSYREIEAQLAAAESRKTFAATAIHERSSRAHTIFQLELTFRTESYTRSPKLVLADLAGSERIKVAKTDTGTALEQACNINLSLLALGNCIEAVMACSKGEKSTDVGEFRTSTLTKLLKDHIGGNSRSAILVTISPSAHDAQLSLQALRFGDRAKHLQTHAKIIQTSLPDNAEQMQQSVVQDLERRRELLEKERELRMQEISLDQRKADLERQSQQLLLAKAQLQQSGQHDYESRVKLIDNQLQTLHQQLRDMQVQRDELDAKFLDVCADHQATLSDVQALQREVERLTAALEAQREEHADDMALQELELRTDHQSLMEEKDHELNALRSSHDASVVEMTQHFVSKLAEAERRSSSLQEQLDTLLAQHTRTTEKLMTSQAASKKDQEALAEHVQQLRAELDAQAQAHRCTLQSAEAEQSALHDKRVALEELTSTLQHRLADVEQHRNDLTERLRTVEDALATKTASETTLLDNLSAAQNEHATALAASADERRKLEERLALVGDNKEKLASELDEARRRLEASEEQGRITSESLSTTAAQVSSLSDTVATQKSQLAAAAEELDAMRATAAKLRGSLSEAESQLAESIDSGSLAASRVAELESQLRSVTEKYEESCRRTDNLARDLASATSREATLGEVVEELREDLDMAMKDVENLRVSQATNNKLYAEAQDQVVKRQERIFNLEGLLKSTNSQLTAAEERGAFMATEAASARAKVVALEAEVNSAAVAWEWMLTVTSATLHRLSQYFASSDAMVDDFILTARRGHDNMFSSAVDKSINLQKRIGSAESEVASLTAELAAARKSGAANEAALREELSLARAAMASQEAQVAELKRTIGTLEEDVATARLAGRRSEQALRDELAELKKQYDALRDEQSTTSQSMRQRLQEEVNYNDMLVQQCMAAQRALSMGLREASMRQPMSSRMSTARRTVDEEMSPRKEALKHFNPNLRLPSGVFSDETLSENGADVPSK